MFKVYLVVYPFSYFELSPIFGIELKSHTMFGLLLIQTTPYQNWEITQYQNIGDNQYQKMGDNSIPQNGR
jgi:hypothetical protein